MAAGSTVLTVTCQAGGGLGGLTSLLGEATSCEQPSQKSLPDLEFVFPQPELDHEATHSYREAGTPAVWAGCSAA